MAFSQTISKPFSIIAKPTGAKCNLACDYCFFLKKERLYPGSQFRMADDILESYISQYLESQPRGAVNFIWQGGEPTLMGLSFFKKALEFQRIYKRSHQTVMNSFQTNGILLDDDWGRFMADHHFLVGLSMDGPPNYHNLYRKAKNLERSHSLVMHGLEILKKYQIDTNILTCISQANVKDPIGTYRYFRDELQIEHLQFIPIVERENIVGNQKGSRLSSRSITGKEFGAFLIPLFDEWIHKDVGSIFVQLFESTIGWYLGYRSSICIFSETCGDCLALEHNGDLYSCDHFVEPGFLLGNIKKSNLKSLVTGSSQLSFGHSKKGLLPLKCHQCDVLALCNGDCVKNRILPDRKGDFPISHLCEGYRSFFRHSKVSMQMMASLIREHKLVQNIMQMV